MPLLLILAWIAGTQFFGLSKDYDQYLIFFDDVRFRKSFFEIATRFEPAFVFLTFVLTRFFSSNSWIYGVSVFLALFIKTKGLFCLNKSSRVFYFFLVLYLARYFSLYELTQLRAALAVSIAFYVFVKRVNEKYIFSDIALLTLAVFFHYSAILFFVFYFLRRVLRVHLLFIFFGVLIGSLLVKKALLAVFPLIFRVFQMYESVGFGSEKSAVLPSAMALDLIFVSISIFLWKKNSSVMKVCVVALIIGFAIYWGFMDYPVVAHRLRELTSIFLLVYAIHAFQSYDYMVRYFSYAIMVSSVPYYIYLNFVYSPLLGVT